MFTHAPVEYICPICVGLKLANSPESLIEPTDFVHQDDAVSAFIASYFVGKNDGHIIVVPNSHSEHLYDLPANNAGRILQVARAAAIAMKQAYNCDGVTLLQNNEPAADQHALHFHLHVFPRYANDGFFSALTEKRQTTVAERRPFVQRIQPVMTSLL